MLCVKNIENDDRTFNQSNLMIEFGKTMFISLFDRIA